MCSIIIPTLNEAHNIGRLLDSLLQQNRRAEIIVVDGGSHDNTVEIAKKYQTVAVLTSDKGRALQMNYGADHANHSPLVFLHADTGIPDDFITEAQKIDTTSWGYFYAKIDSKRPIFRVIEIMMNFRSRNTSVITGDMAITIGRELFYKSGKYAEMQLMEDIEISKRLRKKSKPIKLHSTIHTSSRRWERKGIYKTILLMWKLRLYYFTKRNSDNLVKHYLK